MKNLLKLRIEKDEDGTGELFAEVQSLGFSGQGSACFNLASIESFAKELKQYPFPAAFRPALRGGYWSSDSPARISQEHLSIEVYAIGATGTLGVKVRLASPLLEEDRQDSLHQISAELQTTYSDLERFAAQLNHLVAGQVPEAVLNAGPA